MKLRMCNNCIQPMERDFFGGAFLLLTKRLGISEYQAVVNLHYEDGPAHKKGAVAPSVKAIKNFLYTNKEPREFDMHLQETDWPTMLMSLSHEMVHVKQWLLGELTATKDKLPKQVWRGVQVTDLNIPYHEQPWEVEAHAKMEPLATWVAKEMCKQRGINAEEAYRQAA